MNKPKFKVGQRYRTARGNVIEISEMNGAYARHELISGKDAGSNRFHINSPYAKELTLVCEKIVITTDGKTTTAKLYDNKKLVKSAEAKCSPDDEFDFNIGAAIALERLTGYVHGQLESTLEEEFYTGKVVCVANIFRYLSFTVGKVYQIENGEFKTDSGSYIVGVTSVKDFNDNFELDGVKFLEIVE